MPKPPYARSLSEDLGTITTTLEQDWWGWNKWKLLQTATYTNARSMNDVVTPGFKALQARGVIINNPTSRMKVTSVPPENSDFLLFSPSDPSQWVKFRGDYFARLALDPQRQIGYLSGGVPPFDTTDLKMRCLAQMDRAQAEMAEDIAEFSSLVRTLRHPLNTVRPHFRNYNRIRSKCLRNGMTFANAHAQAWLAVRYGIMPSLQSIGTAVKVIRNWESSITLGRRTSRASAQREFNDERAIPLYQNTEATTVGTTSREFREKLKATVIYNLRPLVVPGVAEKTGTRLKDLPVTAWNLVPYSWLVDQFVNVSAFIDALVNMSDPSITVLTGSISSQLTNRCRINLTASAGTTYIGVNATYTPSVAEEAYSRQVWTPRNDDVYGLTLRKLRSILLTSADSAAVIANMIRR